MEIFHVHTYRCKHAGDETDEQYIKTALSLGAETITFTDHTPFPGDIFRNRMELSQLPEYIESLKILRKKYIGKIEVKIGLECEFLPSMMDFYKDLKSNPDLDILILGQHFYEHLSGTYSFNDDKELIRANEFIGCGDAIISGMKTGLFTVVAHPDRIYRRCRKWTPEMAEVAEKIIKTSAETNTILERNLSSYEKFVTRANTSYWREEFWELVERHNESSVDKVGIKEGLDAHSSEEMISRFKYINNNQ